ncbi:MAG: hypothetical protein ACI924_000521 [Flavobacterium sp.]|jgi:hypothetical protein
MMKIRNKINIIPITLYFIWCLYVVFFYLFRMNSFANESPCGAGYLMIGLPFFTIIFTLFTLLIISILNKIHKKKYFFDYEYIVVLFLLMLFFGVINILF